LAFEALSRGGVTVEETLFAEFWFDCIEADLRPPAFLIDLS
jgi:hypothetical protein